MTDVTFSCPAGYNLGGLRDVTSVQPRSNPIDPRWVSEAEAGLRRLHWRVDRISIMLVENLAPIQGRRTR